MQSSFHGRSFGALSITGNWARKKRGGPYAAGISFARAPYAYHSLWPNDPQECARHCAHAIDDIVKFATSNDVAAFIAEPVMGEGGIIDHYGIVFIAEGRVVQLSLAINIPSSRSLLPGGRSNHSTLHH